MYRNERVEDIKSYLLPAFNWELRKDFLFKPSDHNSCLHQIVQFFMVTGALINTKNSLKGFSLLKK